MTDSPNETQQTTQAPHGSTLIEFPGVNRNRPAWRKELSEKVREIQQRRSREAALEAGEVAAPPRRAPAAPKSSAATAATAGDAAATAAGEEAAKQLGLVPPPEAPELNPLVAAALRRIERARTRAPHAPRPAHGRAQAAAARVIEEQFELEEEQEPSSAQAVRPAKPEKPEKPEAAHASNLVVVTAPKAEVRHRAQPAAEAAPRPEPSDAPAAAPGVETRAADAARPVVKADAAPARTSVQSPRPSAPAPEAAAAGAVSVRHVAAEPAASAATTTTGVPAGSAVASEPAEAKPQPRKIVGVIDDHWLERHGADPLPKVEAAAYDDRAPIGGRVGAALFDLLAVALLCAPFAAVIELTIGEWRDQRVLGSMGGIVAVVMFLYHTCAVALAGRSWGMRLFSLHAVDADSASVPTTWQCAVRALVYMLSLAAFGLGLLYALFDAEGRTAHDLLSRTVVVRE